MSERIDFHSAAPAGMKALGGVYSYLAQTDLPLTLLNCCSCAYRRLMAVPTALIYIPKH